MSEKIPDEIQRKVKEFTASLMEHCDSVRVFVTVHDGDKQVTSSFDWGAGNIFAQQGQVDEWLRIMHEYQRNYARRKDDQDHHNE